MSVWEFTACTEGYRKANGGKEGRGGASMEESRLRELGIEGF